MRILAIESAQLGGSVALLQGESLIAETFLDTERRTARTLLPAVQDLLVGEGWRARDIQLVAVTIGPGSFTGLRIGATVAKVFAYATGAEVLGVGSLEVLAARVSGGPSPLWAVLDAEREQLFAACYRRVGENWREQIGPHIVGKRTWLAGLSPGVGVTGPALDELSQQLPEGIVAAPEDAWTPRATVVGQLAYRRFVSGDRGEPWSLVPCYLRPSAAEEKRDQTT